MKVALYSLVRHGRVTPSAAWVRLADEEDMFHGCELVKAAFDQCHSVEFLGYFGEACEVRHGKLHGVRVVPERKQPARANTPARILEEGKRRGFYLRKEPA